jgi:hypothetical protein
VAPVRRLAALAALVPLAAVALRRRPLPGGDALPPAPPPRPRPSDRERVEAARRRLLAAEQRLELRRAGDGWAALAYPRGSVTSVDTVIATASTRGEAAERALAARLARSAS